MTLYKCLGDKADRALCTPQVVKMSETIPAQRDVEINPVSEVLLTIHMIGISSFQKKDGRIP